MIIRFQNCVEIFIAKYILSHKCNSPFAPSPILAWAESRVGLADQRHRFRELQISSDASGLWRQKASVISRKQSQNWPFGYLSDKYNYYPNRYNQWGQIVVFFEHHRRSVFPAPRLRLHSERMCPPNPDEPEPKRSKNWFGIKSL
jgi:hypothetical protein